MSLPIDDVPVSLGERSYVVRVGRGLIARAGAEIAPLTRRKRVAVVTEETVAALHLPALTKGLAVATRLGRFFGSGNRRKRRSPIGIAPRMCGTARA